MKRAKIFGLLMVGLELIFWTLNCGGGAGKRDNDGRIKYLTSKISAGGVHTCVFLIVGR